MSFFGLKRMKELSGNYQPSDRMNLQEKKQKRKKKKGFSGGVASDVGCVRGNNEDNYVLGKHMNICSADYSVASVDPIETSWGWQIAGVFDGMGGGEMGELASRDTASVFLGAFCHLSDTATKTEVDQTIRKAFLEANNKIVAHQKKYKVFGTTGTVLCTDCNEIKFYHLGDSRAYLLRKNNLQQLTKDQTLAQMKVEVGMYQENDPAAEADKHKLTEYIGRDWTCENIKPVESPWIPVEAGDYILLCSDGLYDMCSDEEILEILRGNHSPQEKADELVKKASTSGGEDNITCVIVMFP